MTNPNKHNMKKITLSLPDDVEEQLRQHAKTHMGGLKGSLSIIVTNALKEYFKRHKAE